MTIFAGPRAASSDMVPNCPMNKEVHHTRRGSESTRAVSGSRKTIMRRNRFSSSGTVPKSLLALSSR